MYKAGVRACSEGGQTAERVAPKAEKVAPQHPDAQEKHRGGRMDPYGS